MLFLASETKFMLNLLEKEVFRDILVWAFYTLGTEIICGLPLRTTIIGIHDFGKRGRLRDLSSELFPVYVHPVRHFSHDVSFGCPP